MDNEKVLESPKKNARRWGYQSSRLVWSILLTPPLSHSFLLLTLSSAVVFSSAMEDDATARRGMHAIHRKSSVVSPGTVYLVFACVSHAIKQEEVRSMLNTRLNVRRSTIRHCVSFFGVCFLSLCLSFSAAGFSHAKSHVCTIKLILYDVEIDLIVSDKHICN